MRSVERDTRTEHAATDHPTAHPSGQEHPAGGGRAVGRRRRWLRFAGHYLEMVVAMFAGMFVLGGALRAVLAVAGVAYSMARYPELMIVEMALTMAVGMAVWMRLRGHGWASTGEMSGAMLVPAVVVVPLVGLDVLGGGTAMMLEHVAMFPLMLAVMLRRRDEYMTHHHTRRRGGRGRRAVRVLARGGVAVLAFLLLPVGVGVVGAKDTKASLYEPRANTVADSVLAAATVPAHDPDKPTAAVLIGPEGANAADALATYEVLATTGAFNLYTVAPERRPLPLTGGLDLVPHLTFAELGQRLGPTGAPDVVVVPDMPKTDPVVAWLQQQRQRHEAHGTVLLSVCYGARVLTRAGLLDGRNATTAWLGLPWLSYRNPDVTWHRGVRYVEDGTIISTAAVLSGVEGALRVVERLVGPPAATAAARAIGWRHHAPGGPASIPAAKLTRADAVAGLNLAFRSHPRIGILLTDGVREIELASAFSPYTEQSYAARTLALGTGPAVRSAHGLTFVPRAALAGAGDRVDRLIVPGAQAARDRDPRVAALARAEGLAPTYLHQRPGFAYDAALRDIASTFDGATARHAAKRLEYPAAAADLAGPGIPPTLLLRPLLLGLIGLAAAIATDRLLRARRRPERVAVRAVAAPATG
jgi:transcriptional regulator GlxA family with amidase domain